MRKAIAFVLTALILFYSLIIFTSCSQGQSTPTIYVDPSWTTVQPNETAVSINVSITQATNVSGWEFSLYYANSILHSVTATEGDFLAKGGPSTWFWIEELNDNYNSTHGRVSLACLQLGNATEGVDGSGTLATITFQPLSGGTSTLHLSNLDLVDPGANKIRPINSSDGTIQVMGAVDIAVNGVTPLKTVVGQRYNMEINVTIRNQGDQTTTFNVTTYANNSAVSTIFNTSLPNGGSTILTFTWNTSGFAYGNYTLSAYVPPVPGDTNTANNNCTCTIPVHVGVPGDVSGTTPGVYDGVVNMKDVAYLVSLFNTRPSSPNWKPNADVNDDGVVNMKDIAIAVVYFNQHE